jgi:hypothetical protein
MQAMDHSPSPLDDVLAQAGRELAGEGVEARAAVLRRLLRDGLDRLPPPAGGATLQRWRALAAVAAHDLPLAKLYEGHTDALAILAEAGQPAPARGLAWGMWAAEAPGARVILESTDDGACMLAGTKAWCSGARALDAGLLTVWRADGAGPFLAAVHLDASGVSFDDGHWQAAGMAASGSVDIRFDRTPARLVGGERFYLERPGFWQGGIGIAACWHGGALGLARALHAQARAAGASAGWHRLAALGGVDTLLCAQAALLREAARWLDAHPRADARAWALRTRAAADAGAQEVLRLATRALGATPLCRDAAFARRAADLPVYLRQCHGDRDLAALGEAIASADSQEAAWDL